MEYLATGEYLEVGRPSRLRYTRSMPQFSANTDTITVQIEEDGHGCSVTFEQEGEDIAQELRELPAGETSQSKQAGR